VLFYAFMNDLRALNVGGLSESLHRMVLKTPFTCDMQVARMCRHDHQTGVLQCVVKK
jgi:hypothetical protein